MELVYLWLEDYINIKNCGFNFGNRVIIKETINIADKTLNLSVTDNPSYIDHFFGTRIRNITGIVGGNGVGKSNLLDFLKSFLLNKNYIDVKWLAVFFNQETEDFLIIHSLYVVNKSTKDNQTKFEDEWNVSLSNNTKFKFRDVQRAFHEHHFIEEAYGSPQILELNSSVIFYSPFLDFRDYPGGKWTTEYMDVSTNYLVYTDSEDAPKERDKLELHHFKNIERQFLFVQNNKKLVEELNLPSDLQVRFVKTDDINKDDLGFRIQAFYKKFRDFSTSTWNTGPNAIIREGKEKRSKKILEEGLKWKLKMWFSINLVSNYLYNYAFLVDLHDEYFPGDATLKDFNFENTDTIALAKQFFATLTFPNNRKFDFIEFIDYINNVIDTKADVLSNRDDNECYFYVPPEIALEIWGRHHNYLSVFPNENRLRGFLELNWRDISSGEKSFLDLFSRLYSAISTLAVSEHLNSLVYILLDEGEAGFHPNWQKAYIAYLIRFFEQMKGLDFALITATHSPFIVSDLPSENLILLDKNKDGFCVVKDTLDSVKKTFGANIHILLADSFFMQEGLIGSFAKGKIEEVIQWLHSTDRQNNIVIKRIINLIDEPLIKVKLTEMYAEKMGLNFEEERIREQIQQLNERLDELNKKKQ